MKYFHMCRVPLTVQVSNLGAATIGDRLTVSGGGLAATGASTFSTNLVVRDVAPTLQHCCAMQLHPRSWAWYERTLDKSNGGVHWVLHCNLQVSGSADALSVSSSSSAFHSIISGDASTFAGFVGDVLYGEVEGSNIAATALLLQRSANVDVLRVTADGHAAISSLLSVTGSMSVAGATTVSGPVSLSGSSIAFGATQVIDSWSFASMFRVTPGARVALGA
jgi:hypothetical protein